MWEQIFINVLQNVMVIRLIHMIFNNQVLTGCIIIGFIDFGIMFKMSKPFSPQRYSKYRENRMSEMKEWLKEYNQESYSIFKDQNES